MEAPPNPEQLSTAVTVSGSGISQVTVMSAGVSQKVGAVLSTMLMVWV